MQTAPFERTAGHVRSNSLTLPCRLNDTDTPELMVMTLGEIETPLKQADYDLATDTIRVSGATVRDYYKRNLGVKYFKPIDPSFLKCASGWCSWMYYGRDVTPEEVLVNARWFAQYMRPYGLTLIQIDDGWQGDMRNWDGLREPFNKGMKHLADEIRELGLEPGIWICPCGQENEEVIRNAGCFIKAGTMGGPYTVDTTRPEGIRYIQQLVHRLSKDWGYSYLKLDGIGGGYGYGALAAYQKHQHELADPNVGGDEAFRRYLQAVWDGAGKGTFIGGMCCNSLESAGLAHSSRVGNDTNPEFQNGFMNAVVATMRGHFMHNIGWYTDPDACLLRPPLTFQMAQAWASLLGVTGQMLLLGDRMPDLGPERVALIKKISPVAAIKPFDLFPAKINKHVFDLKINQHGRAYDVVAVFNYSETVQRSEYLNFARLGLNEHRYHAYDFWARDYLGVYDAGVFLEVPPGARWCATPSRPPSDFVRFSTLNRLRFHRRHSRRSCRTGRKIVSFEAREQRFEVHGAGALPQVLKVPVGFQRQHRIAAGHFELRPLAAAALAPEETHEPGVVAGVQRKNRRRVVKANFDPGADFGVKTGQLFQIQFDAVSRGILVDIAQIRVARDGMDRRRIEQQNPDVAAARYCLCQGQFDLQQIGYPRL